MPRRRLRPRAATVGPSSWRRGKVGRRCLFTVVAITVHTAVGERKQRTRLDAELAVEQGLEELALGKVGDEGVVVGPARHRLTCCLRRLGQAWNGFGDVVTVALQHRQYLIELVERRCQF